MKRYRVDFGYGRYYFEPNEAGDWVRFEDHEAIVKHQAQSALAGMNAAKAISSNDLQRAARLRAESSPDALESERQANAKLTQELSLAEEGLANYAQEIASLRNDLTACQLERDGMRGLLVVAWEALTGFMATYNGRPSRFHEAEIASSECIVAAADKLDEFLYPPEPQSGS